MYVLFFLIFSCRENCDTKTSLSANKIITSTCSDNCRTKFGGQRYQWRLYRETEDTGEWVEYTNLTELSETGDVTWLLKTFFFLLRTEMFTILPKFLWSLFPCSCSWPRFAWQIWLRQIFLHTGWSGHSPVCFWFANASTVICCFFFGCGGELNNMTCIPCIPFLIGRFEWSYSAVATECTGGRSQSQRGSHLVDTGVICVGGAVPFPH